MADDQQSPEEQLAADNTGFLEGEEVRTGLITGVTFELKSVEYSVVGDRAVFEGDIVLGTVDELERSTALLSSDALEHDGEIVHGVGITGQQFRWPNALMPYEVDSALPSKQRVTDAIAHWESKTNMRFVQRTSANASQHPNYVRVIPSDGCWSYVGMRGGKQELGLASGCGLGATIHEFGHAWGLWHEQSREDRDTYITIHWQNIQAGREHNFYQHISDGDDIGAYDYASLMHYGRYAFSKNGQPTITPKQTGVEIGQRNGLSQGDIAAVHAMYRTWHYNLTVQQTYATTHSMNAWANLAGLGWRKIEPLSKDGVSNMFKGFVWARAKDRKVHVLADGSTVYQMIMT